MIGIAISNRGAAITFTVDNVNASDTGSAPTLATHSVVELQLQWVCLVIGMQALTFEDMGSSLKVLFACSN